MKKFNLTVDDVLSIINDRNKGMYVDDIAIKYDMTNAMVSTLYKAYNGNTKYYEKLGVESKKILDECLKLKGKNISKPQKYEVKILFGLITLKINPIINEI